MRITSVPFVAVMLAVTALPALTAPLPTAGTPSDLLASSSGGDNAHLGPLVQLNRRATKSQNREYAAKLTKWNRDEKKRIKDYTFGKSKPQRPDQRAPQPAKPRGDTQAEIQKKIETRRKKDAQIRDAGNAHLTRNPADHAPAEKPRAASPLQSEKEVPEVPSRQGLFDRVLGLFRKTPAAGSSVEMGSIGGALQSAGADAEELGESVGRPALEV